MEQASFTGAELAARARVDPGLVDRLVELGILAPPVGEAIAAGRSSGPPRPACPRPMSAWTPARVPLKGVAAPVPLHRATRREAYGS